MRQPPCALMYLYMQRLIHLFFWAGGFLLCFKTTMRLSQGCRAVSHGAIQHAVNIDRRSHQGVTIPPRCYYVYSALLA